MVQTPEPIRAGDGVELRLARSAIAFIVVLGIPVVAVAGLLGGVPGALSAGIGALVVIGMFLMAGATMSWAARISPAALMGAVLGGYLVRLVIYALLIVLLRPVEWLSGTSLAISTAILLVAVLAWEVRVASRNPSMFWIDPAAGQRPAAAVVYSPTSTGPGASSQSAPPGNPSAERTRP
jgi:hypothetical protein